MAGIPASRIRSNVSPRVGLYLDNSVAGFRFVSAYLVDMSENGRVAEDGNRHETPMTTKLFAHPWQRHFLHAVSQARRELLICSPFVNREGARLLAKGVAKRSNIELVMITNLSPRNILSGASDPRAILQLYQDFARARVSSLGRLHAKVYIIDGKVGIVTSANLTRGGLATNFEYGVLIQDQTAVCEIRRDILQYHSLGNVIDCPLLKALIKSTEELDEVKKRIDGVAASSGLTRVLRAGEEQIADLLLKNRVRSGGTVNSIFCDTIIHLLRREGPLSTAELHPIIQSIHPDICDDSIDRVIDGQHFGKKWKHMVRNAQQALKKDGQVRLEAGRWILKM